MKILSKVILILIIVVPIVLCVTTLNKVWNEDENKDKINAGLEESGKISGDASIFFTAPLFIYKLLTSSGILLFSKLGFLYG